MFTEEDAIALQTGTRVPMVMTVHANGYTTFYLGQDALLRAQDTRSRKTRVFEVAVMVGREVPADE